MAGNQYIPKVSKRGLLVLAGLVWSFAGYKVLGLGIQSLVSVPALTIAPFFISAATFILFFRFVFYPMLKKHKLRILSLSEERNPFYIFLDIKGYVIMAIMITLGIVIRRMNFIPPVYLGTFYCGLGSALLAAGIGFVVSCFLMNREMI